MHAHDLFTRAINGKRDCSPRDGDGRNPFDVILDLYLVANQVGDDLGPRRLVGRRFGRRRGRGPAPAGLAAREAQKKSCNQQDRHDVCPLLIVFHREIFLHFVLSCLYSHMPINLDKKSYPAFPMNS